MQVFLSSHKQVLLDHTACSIIAENAMANALRYGCPTRPCVALHIDLLEHADMLEACTVQIRITNRANPLSAPVDLWDSDDCHSVRRVPAERSGALRSGTIWPSVSLGWVGGCGVRAGLSLGTSKFFCLGQPVMTAPKDHQPPAANPRQPPAANRRQPLAIVQYWFCGFVCCPCLDHEAENVPVNVRFCWHHEPFFPVKDSPGWGALSCG